MEDSKLYYILRQEYNIQNHKIRGKQAGERQAKMKKPKQPKEKYEATKRTHYENRRTDREMDVKIKTKLEI